MADQPIVPSSAPPAAAAGTGVDNIMALQGENEQDDLNRGANWFYWIAALSLLNSIIALFQGNFIFLAGLAITQIADGFASQAGFAGPYVSLGFGVIVAVFLCGFGYLAKHGSPLMLLIGMALYAIDGAIFLWFSAWMPAAFHAFVLYQMALAWLAYRKARKLNEELAIIAAAK